MLDTTIYLLVIIFLGVLFLGFFTFFIVEQQSAIIIERFGRFVRICSPGLNIKIPFIETIRGNVSLRIMQLNVEVETKTADNVFVKIITAVQYRVLPKKVFEAFYTLDNPEIQIQSFVFDVVRAKVPKINLDDVFAKKDEIADSVRDELRDVMNEFGFDIIKALVTDINPDAKVKAAMNDINEAQRLRVAATERGEAEKILKIKQAEAEAQSKILQGAGISGERKAIIKGLKESLHDFHQAVDHISTQEVMNLILIAQYFDTLRNLGNTGKLNTILLPHSPGGLQDLLQQFRESIIVGDLIKSSST